MLELLENWHTPTRSIIVATHDLNLVPDLADECIVLDHGKVLAQGTPKEILKDAEVLARANLVDARR